MTMNYMATSQNGYPPTGTYHNMQPFGSNHHQHGYSYPYPNERLLMLAQLQQYHQHQRAVLNQGNPPPQPPPQSSRQSEHKPRMSKDDVEILEREFQKNSKPTSGRKREIAEMLKVEHPRINNWFQNRRAKEKQMKKTREFKAQQAAEQAVSESDSPDAQEEGTVSEYYGTSQHTQPLQASSAAFPSSDASSSNDSADLYARDHDEQFCSNDATPLVEQSSSLSEDGSSTFSHDQYPSPNSLTFQGGDASELGFTSMGNGFLPSQASNTSSVFESQQIHGTNGNVNDQAQPSRANDFNAPRIVAPVPSYPSQLLGADTNVRLEGDGQHEEHGLVLQLTSPGSSSRSPPDTADLRFKSPPPPSNIASRRNKGVPTQLSSTALRSYSYGPKTGIDLGKRSEAPSPMRRIASATGLGPGRIQKSGMGSAPRSPMYLERTKEALMRSLQGTRSPILGSLNTALSPASECQVSAPQGIREATVSSSASDDEQRYTLGGSQASYFSTLKTPPSTPGMGRNFPDQMMAIESAWNYVPQDEPLITPSLGSFGSEEFAMTPSAPGYAVSSQPPTPSFAPGMSSNYFPWSLNGSAPSHAEYNFGGEPYMGPDSSAKSSPGTKSRQFQFARNITPQHFSEK